MERHFNCFCLVLVSMICFPTNLSLAVDLKTELPFGRPSVPQPAMTDLLLTDDSGGSAGTNQQLVLRRPNQFMNRTEGSMKISLFMHRFQSFCLYFTLLCTFNCDMRSLCGSPPM